MLRVYFRAGEDMRAKLYLGILIAVAIAFGVTVSACSSAPEEPPAAALNWDDGTWDNHNWK
jgi:hypothetical protein